MEKALGALMLVGLLTQVQGWHSTHDRRPQRAAMGISTYAPRASASRPSGASHGFTSVNANEVQLIADVARTYGVPEGALYGVWMKESSGSREGWRNTENWIPASDLARPDSKCAVNYDAKRCAERWRMIQALCGQRVDGRVLCDPNEIRVTYGMAMGMLQHMPNVVLRPKGNGYVWAPQAVDYDRDGFRNPFDLEDAMAWTALELRAHYDRAVAKGKAKPWREAVTRYSGAGNYPYYDGEHGKRGVHHYWADWQSCRTQGSCVSLIATSRR